MEAKKLCNTLALTQEQWLECRRKGIGGSDAAKIFGLVPYPNSTPYTLWLQKTGKVPIEDSESESAHFGRVLEAVVADEFESRSKDVYGKKITLRRSNCMWQHPEYPWMIANIDRTVVGNPKAGFEAKTTNTFLGGEWQGDLVPDAYYIQCQHYMAVMGWDLVYIACLIGGQRFVTKPIHRNDDFIAAMIEREKAFWEENVLKDEPPAITAADDPSLYFPEQTCEAMLPVTDQTRALASDLAKLKQVIKDLETQESELRNRLAMIIGDNVGIEGLCTWKANKPSRKTDWQGLAIELGASHEQIERYTTEKPGARVLRLIQKGVA